MNSLNFTSSPENLQKKEAALLLIGISLAFQGLLGVSRFFFPNALFGNYYLAPFDIFFSPVFLGLGAATICRWRHHRILGISFCSLFLGFHILYFSLEGSPEAKERLVFLIYFFYFLFCVLALSDRMKISLPKIEKKGPIIGLAFTGWSLLGYGLFNILFAEWFRGALQYEPESFLVSLLSMLLGLALLFGWRYARRVVLLCAWAYLALSLSEFLMAGSEPLSHKLIPAASLLWSALSIWILRASSVKALFSEEEAGPQAPRVFNNIRAATQGEPAGEETGKRKKRPYGIITLSVSGLIAGVFASWVGVAFSDNFSSVAGVICVVSSLLLLTFRNWVRVLVIVLSVILLLTYLSILVAAVAIDPSYAMGLFFYFPIASLSIIAIIHLTQARVKAKFRRRKDSSISNLSL